MRNMQQSMGKWHSAKIFAMLLACALLFLPGCRNVLDSQDTAGTGTFSLTINRQDVERAIMPDISADIFARFELRFVPRGTGETVAANWSNASGTVMLAMGTWDLDVTAFLPGGLKAATGRLEGIELRSGEYVSGNVELIPIPGGTGTFSWDIGFGPESFVGSLRFARMEIREAREPGHYESHWGTFYLADNLGGNVIHNPHYIEMDAGHYHVILTLENSQGERVVIHEILHVHRYMGSRFSRNFTVGDFPETLLGHILGAWDGSSWNFAERGIVAGHFSIVGVNGINDDNFDDIVQWFKVLQAAVGGNPTCCCQLRSLTDAALIGIASTDANFLDASNYEHRAAAEIAIAELLRNGNAPWFNWADYRTVSVSIGYHTVLFIFSADIDLLPEPQPGDSLADWLVYLRLSAQSDGTYNIVISGDEEISSLQAALPTGRENLTIALSANVPSTVSLSDYGSLFVVNSGLTLVLGNNVTLQGRGGNYRALVRVYSGGTLVMNTGSVITGNVNTNDVIAYQGGGVQNMGTFTMHGGTITGNTALAGGGVDNFDGGIFTMYAGEIYGNTANVFGGGVNTWFGGTFAMQGGEISGNTAQDGGGVKATDSGIFTMYDGDIFDNHATSNGGGVVVIGNWNWWHGGVATTSFFNMYGGRIFDNTAHAGGGVANLTDGRFRMHEGTISGNEAGFGGGVFNSGVGWLFTMYGGAISGNTAQNGGGVNNQGGNATFIMAGGVIYGINAEPELANMADSGAALLNFSIAQYGTFSNGNFHWAGDLYTTNYTMRVANGVRPGGYLSISLADFQEIGIYIPGDLSVSILHGTSATVTVLDPGQFDYIRWFHDGSQISWWSWRVSGSHGETFILDANLPNNRLGRHSVTVEVRMGGALYSKRIAFTVVP